MGADIGIKPNMESQKITTDAYREGWERIWKKKKEDTSVPPVINLGKK